MKTFHIYRVFSDGVSLILSREAESPAQVLSGLIAGVDYLVIGVHL